MNKIWMPCVFAAVLLSAAVFTACGKLPLYEPDAPTATATCTVMFTLTATQTQTQTLAHTLTATLTASPSSTATEDISPTDTATPTHTDTPVQTMTYTATATLTATELPTTVFLREGQQPSSAYTFAMDTTLYSGGYNDMNFGSCNELSIGYDGSALIRRSLLYFDINSVLPANAKIERVLLYLYLSTTLTSTEPMEIRLLTTGWGEGAQCAGAAAADYSSTWDDAVKSVTPWTTPGGDMTAPYLSVNFSGNSGDLILIQLDSIPSLLADIQSWVDNPGTNHGFMLKVPDETAATETIFVHSIEASEINLRPMLQIQYR